MSSFAGPVLFFLAFVSLTAAAADTPTQNDCSLKALTKDCKDVPAAKNPLNPWTIEAKGESPAARPSMDVSQEMTEEDDLTLEDPDKTNAHQEFLLKTQADLLGKISAGSPMFKLALTSPDNMATLAQNLDTEGMPSALLLPWPPSGKNSKIQAVEFSDFKKQYLDRLPPAQKKVLLQKAKAVSEENMNFYGQMQEEQEPPPPDPKVELAEKLKKSQLEKMKKDQNARVQALFKKAQKYLIEEIKARPFTTEENQKRMIEKIQSITFSGVDPDVAQCQKNQMNAFYNATTHSFSLCSLIVNLSDEGIVFLMGHELGHSVDACGVQNGVYKVNEFDDAKVLAFLKEQNEDESLARSYVSKLKAGRMQEQLGYLNVDFSDQEMAGFEKMGVLTTEVKPVPGTYPLDTVYRCLKDNYHFYDGEETRGTRLIDKKAERLKDIQPATAGAKWRLPRCEDKSEMREAMADVFGAKVMARYAAAEGHTRPEDFKEAMAPLMFSSCVDQRILANDPHPFGRERIEKIVGADPLVQKVFNCKIAPEAKPYCMNKFGHAAPPSAASASEKEGEGGAVK